MTAPPPSTMTFADLLRHHRLAAGLTQGDLAERAQLSVDAISTLERGARRWPHRDTVVLLAEALVLPDEERVAFFAAARRSSAPSLAATPPATTAAQSGDDATATSAADYHGPVSAEVLPHGVVTFLFANIEGSTPLLHQFGDDHYADMLAQVQALLRSVWVAHTGHELGTQGDEFFVVFAHADNALDAAATAQQALAVQSWPEDAQVRVRIGLHSGAALLTAGRYVGLEVLRAARIAAAGHGGQVLVSSSVAEQVAKFGYALPEGTRLRYLGAHRLQDLPQREQLYELVLPTLPGPPTTYPPLRTLDGWPGVRAALTAVMMISAPLLAAVGLLLPAAVPVFPWAVGLGAAALGVVVLLVSALAQPVRRALQMRWRRTRRRRVV